MWSHVRWISWRIPASLALHHLMWLLPGGYSVNPYYKATNNPTFSHTCPQQTILTHATFLSMNIRTSENPILSISSPLSHVKCQYGMFTLYGCLMVGLFLMVKAVLLLHVNSTHQVCPFSDIQAPVGLVFWMYHYCALFLPEASPLVLHIVQLGWSG